MIKINLAAAASKRAIGGGGLGNIGDGGLMLEDEVRKEAAKRVLLILVVPVLLYLYEQQNIPEKTGTLRNRTTTLSEIQAYNEKAAASVAEIKRFKEEEAKIEARIAALNKIGKDRQKEVRVMELMQSVLPEKAWITRLDVRPEKMVVEGLALSDYEVSALMEALTNSAFLMDVNLVSSKEEMHDGMSLKKFEVSCVLERPR